MKTQLTAEESAKLIELGVSPERASETCIDFNGRYAYVHGEEAQTVRDCVNGHFYAEECRIFTLSDIIDILPKSIEHNGYAEAKLNIYTRPHRRECWVVKYIVSAKTILYDGAGYELIDALYKVLHKLLDDHVKLD